MKCFRFIMNNRNIYTYKPFTLHIIDNGCIFVNLLQLLLLLCTYNYYNYCVAKNKI
jgi:hypothetical protein